VRALAPFLRDLNWEIAEGEETIISAKVPSGTIVVYHPVSISLLTEIDLLWDGKFYTLTHSENRGLYVPSAQLPLAQAMAKQELEVWRTILKP
jgi:hypothetical protein